MRDIPVIGAGNGCTMGITKDLCYNANMKQIPCPGGSKNMGVIGAGNNCSLGDIYLSGPYTGTVDTPATEIQRFKVTLYGQPDNGTEVLPMYPNGAGEEAVMTAATPVFYAAPGTALGLITNVYTDSATGKTWLEVANNNFNNPVIPGKGYIWYDSSVFDTDRAITDTNTAYDADVESNVTPALKLKAAKDSAAEDKAGPDWIPGVPNVVTAIGGTILGAVAIWGAVKLFGHD